MRAFQRSLARYTSLFGLLIVVSSSAEDWTQWRGIHRDGKSNESGLLDKWPADGPDLVWQANDLGGGYSTPSSAAGALYFVVSEGMETEKVVALSLVDGAEIWSTKIGKVGKNQGPQYPGSRCTPTIDGSSIFVLGSDGDLACLDAKTGSINWSKSLRSEFGGRPGNWAYTESPLIDGDVLVCSPGGPEATVVALNKTDGSVIWKSPLDQGDAASYSSPVIATVDGTKQYVLFLAKGLVGLSAETGQPLWRYAGTADKDANIQTPVVHGDLVYSAASRVGGALIRVNNGTSEPEELFFAKTLPSGIGGSVLVDGKLFGGSGPTQICIDFMTGKPLWQDRSIGAGSLCYADGKLIIHGENNEVAMIEATGDGYQELGRFTPPGGPDRGSAKAWSYPIIVDGKLIIRDMGTIWCYNLRG